MKQQPGLNFLFLILSQNVYMVYKTINTCKIIFFTAVFGNQ